MIIKIIIIQQLKITISDDINCNLNYNIYEILKNKLEQVQEDMRYYMLHTW